MNITIERAQAKDALKLIEVQNRSFYDDYVLYGLCPSYDESEEAMRKHISTALVYKILSDGELIGDMIVVKMENSCYYLRVIAVVPEYWGFRVGTKAMEYIEKDNPNAVEWSLITPNLSYRNHHFYEKLGYVKVGERPEPGHDTLVLWQYRKTM